MKNVSRQERGDRRRESPCPLCQANTKFFLFQPHREYRQCLNCRLIFVPTRFFLTRDEEKTRYLEHENSLNNPGYVKMFQDKIDVVRTICSGVVKVLDYGCGYEPVLKTLLLREGYLAEEYDTYFFPQRKLVPGYDLIISTETFEHFREPKNEVDKLVSLLSPMGYLAVMTRFFPEEGHQSSSEVFQNWYYQRDPTHIVFYSSHTFAWIAKDKGLKIIYNNEKDFIILQNSPDNKSFF